MDEFFCGFLCLGLLEIDEGNGSTLALLNFSVFLTLEEQRTHERRKARQNSFPSPRAAPVTRQTCSSFVVVYLTLASLEKRHNQPCFVTKNSGVSWVLFVKTCSIEPKKHMDGYEIVVSETKHDTVRSC